MVRVVQEIRGVKVEDMDWLRKADDYNINMAGLDIVLNGGFIPLKSKPIQPSCLAG